MATCHQLITCKHFGSTDLLKVCRVSPAIRHCSHLLLKCRVATNISYWLKVHSRWFKTYIFAKKCILISFWIFQYCFYYSFTLYYCAIFISLNAGFFSIPSSGVKQFGPRSGLTKCRADDKSRLLLAKNSQLLDSFLAKTLAKVNSIITFGSNFFHLAKVLATTSSKPG